MYVVNGTWYYSDDGLVKPYEETSRLDKWMDPDPKERIIDPLRRSSVAFCMATTTEKKCRFTGLILLDGVKNLHSSHLERIFGNSVEIFMAKDNFDLREPIIGISCDE